MKITSIISDELILEVKRLSKAKNITEAVKIALNHYVAIQKLKELGNELNEKPLKLKHEAEEIRALNRQ